MTSPGPGLLVYTISPESILSEHGKVILSNFLRLQGAPPLIDFFTRINKLHQNIRHMVNAAEKALIYAKAGASVISVLTESKWFKGNFSNNLGMEPLVEVNNEEEMRRAVKLGAKVIGLNHTFDVDMNTTSRLAELVPEGVMLVALSGITGRADVVSYREQEEENANVDSATLSLKIKAPRSPLVKICGILTIEVAIEAADAGADIIGLIFANSRRQVLLNLALEIVNVIREMQSEKTIEITDDKDELTPCVLIACYENKSR
ncbi:1607_t:CDS:2 [Funneliformis mosseae]|uniref:indole-3-glycerol-phosphate synthase n=1 Tax=Funneliformis mosseae TaxID=27381 RepID=A0A9N8VWP2_FUNMO|nr:1607_t:CDS:2 [Funneliformis mosseae]